MEYTMSQFASKDDMISAMRDEITTLRARVKGLEEQLKDRETDLAFEYNRAEQSQVEPVKYDKWMD